MNKRSIIRHIWVGMIATFSTIGLLHATSQPKFTIIPITPTAVTVTYNSTATVQYTVTNQTKITRTLTMVPPTISGITQISSGAGNCSAPFTLAQHQSCTLTLQLNGASLPIGFSIVSIEVCNTNSPQNNNPDRFLCSQTSRGNELAISRLNSASYTVNPTALSGHDQDIVSMTVNPTALTLTIIDHPGTVTLTNNSPTVVATHVSARLTADLIAAGIKQDDRDCVSIPTLGSCALHFTPGDTPVSGTLQVYGDNTTQTELPIVVNSPINPTIAVFSPSSLTFPLDNTTSQSLVIKNMSTVPVYDIHANFTDTALEHIIAQTGSTCRGPIEPQQNCTLTLTLTSNALTAIPATLIPISGAGTQIINTTITVGN